MTDYYQASPLVARDNGVLCGRQVIISNSVTSIGTNAFSGNELSAVSIPNSVTAIGDSAFSSNQLTSVSIPSSVSSIGISAFAANQLTTVTIPNGVSIIEQGAFMRNYLTSVTLPDNLISIEEAALSFNKLTSVAIPNSVTSIDYLAFSPQSQWGSDIWNDAPGVPYIFGNDPVEVQAAYDGLWYAQLYTQDPSNPNNLQDAVADEEYWNWDANNNGINDSWGGHLINPAQLTMSYINQENSSVSTSRHFVGAQGETYFTNYYVTQGPNIEWLERIVDWTTDYTPETYLAINDAFASYYRLGDEVTITPPPIGGYNTPPTQTFVLGAATNEFSYVYAAQSSSASGGELAETGMSIVHVTGFALVAIAIGIASWLMAKRQRGIKI